MFFFTDAITIQLKVYSVIDPSVMTGAIMGHTVRTVMLRWTIQGALWESVTSACKFPWLPVSSNIFLSSP